MRRATTLKRFDIVAFDVDGTLVNAPNDFTVWEVLNERFIGTASVNKDRYARYCRGATSSSPGSRS